MPGSSAQLPQPVSLASPLASLHSIPLGKFTFLISIPSTLELHQPLLLASPCFYKTLAPVRSFTSNDHSNYWAHYHSDAHPTAPQIPLQSTLSLVVPPFNRLPCSNSRIGKQRETVCFDGFPVSDSMRLASIRCPTQPTPHRFRDRWRESCTGSIRGHTVIACDLCCSLFFRQSCVKSFTSIISPLYWSTLLSQRCESKYLRVGACLACTIKHSSNQPFYQQ